MVRAFRLVALSAVLVGGSPAFADSKRKLPPKSTCKRVIAKELDASELRLVGVIAQGRQRKILLLDRTNFGYIIKPGECVGRERQPFHEWFDRRRELLQPRTTIARP